MAAQHILVVDDDAGFAEATGAVLRSRLSRHHSITFWPGPDGP